MKEDEIRRLLKGDETAIGIMTDHYWGLVIHMCRFCAGKQGYVLSPAEEEELTHVVMTRMVMERISDFTVVD